MRILALLALAACTGSPSQQPGAPDAPVTPPSIDAPQGPDVDAPAADDPTAGVEWFTWVAQQPALNDAAWGQRLTEIAQHIPSMYGSTYWDADPITAGHETTHGIQAHLRNYQAPSGPRVNAFYVTGDRAAFVVEPNMRKADIAAVIPASLQGDRFATYLTGQTEWDDTPLYVFDEWTAYCNGAAVGVDQVQHDLYKGQWTDAVMGPLEFVAYAIATAYATSQKDPTYFATNLQFRRFTAWQIARAMTLFDQGRTMTEFTWDHQDAYAAALRTSPDAEALRAFARQTWGAAWTLATLGF